MHDMSSTDQSRHDTASTHALGLASRGKRFASMMYEGVLLFGVVFTADYLFDTLTQSKHALMFRPGRQAWLLFAIGFYFVLCWWRGGQTLPMKAWHLRIVTRDGSPPTIKQLIGRYLLLWPLPLAGTILIHGLVTVTGWPAFYAFAIVTPFLIFIPTWFETDGRFLHDRLMGTDIVNVSRRADRAAPHKIQSKTS
jgi:uncharacterized RDD family membrane protein YckC